MRGLTVLLLLSVGCGPGLDDKQKGSPGDEQTAVGSESCGDGTLDPGELCDPGIASGQGACPTSCSAGACGTATLFGSAATCDAQCVNEGVACANDDGCCSAGCDSTTDNDCGNVCGDGVTEGPETCDGNCPTACNDGDPCTDDALVGAAASCTAACSFKPIASCAANNGGSNNGVGNNGANNGTGNNGANNGTTPTCTPKTCAQAGATCGMVADGCGGTLNCGTCPTGSLPDGYGDACETFEDCSLPMPRVCIDGGNGGYCTRNCEEETCPNGMHCGFYAGQPTCFPDCTSNADCRSGEVCADYDGMGTNECGAPRATVPAGQIGAACRTDADCSNSFCYTTHPLSQTTIFPNGFCTDSCDPFNTVGCPAGTGCPALAMVCSPTCTTDADCRAGYQCLDGVIFGRTCGVQAL